MVIIIIVLIRIIHIIIIICMYIGHFAPFGEKNIFSAASNVNMNKIIGFKKDGVRHSFLEEYDE